MDNSAASPKASKTPNGVNATAQSLKDGAQAGQTKPSGAELKRLKQAEKQARRQKEKAEKAVQGPAAAVQPPPPARAQGAEQQPRQHQQGRPSAPSTTRREPASQAPKRRASTGGEGTQQPAPKQALSLYPNLSEARRHTIAGVSKDVHPAVLSLGLQISSYQICGSTARCVAMLLAFKRVIESYVTPPGTSLARHLTNHHLGPQIEYLKSCRPLSTSMGNAIRALKDKIIKIDPSVPEEEARESLLETIDLFIQERITAADTVISQTASQKIVNGDVILTFAKSSLVLQTFLKAHEGGVQFRVVVVDSKPLFEGKRLAADLASAGIEVQYYLVSAASRAMKKASKVFVGAHSMMANGMLLSRCGTAVIAMLAHEREVPVIVCCESVKFTEKVALDSNGNELAPSEELFVDGVTNGGDAEAEEHHVQMIKSWTDTPNLYQVNPMFDLTDREYIKMVVTEYGSIPPTSVSAVLRILESANEPQAARKVLLR